MRPGERLPAVVLACATLSLAGCDAAGPAIRVPDLAGASHAPIPGAGGPATVLIFVMQDCPIANAYAPEIAALAKAWARRGARTFVVHVDARATAADLARHAGEYGLPGPVLWDRDHRLVRRCGVATTPEAVLFAPGGRLAYRGRIDDRFPQLDVRRRAPVKRELRDAVDAVLAGREVAVPHTAAVGCAIRDVDGR